MRSKLLASV
uniref:Uncharacterized protein n=1 Tax=Arundo donax TaxID=35708 RepID=A0A0A9BLJ7_ARUDO